MRLALLSLATTVVVLAGCATRGSPLPTLASWNGGCRGVGFEATLNGSPSDPRITWITASGGQRHEIVWPPGYTARFTPNLEVLDANGNVVFREGSRVSGGCVTGPNSEGPLLIAAGY